MPKKRRVANPLALAVMSCLSERPMHPYEIASTLRHRGTAEAIKLNYGSLYTVMEQLCRHGFAVAQETTREGNRPERTIYRLTADGRAELTDWLSELIARPVKEFTQFEAGLALLGGLSPDAAVGLLTERAATIEAQLAEGRARIAEVIEREKVPRLFLIEWEYKAMLAEAELAWVRQLVAEIRAGTLEGVELWRKFRQAEAETAGTAE